MSDPIEDNLPGGTLRPLNCILLRLAVQEDVQLWRLSDPTAIEFVIQLNRELHSPSLARTPKGRWNSAEHPLNLVSRNQTRRYAPRGKKGRGQAPTAPTSLVL